MGHHEAEGRHLRSSPQTLPEVFGAEGAHAGPLEAAGGQVQSQPQDRAQRTGPGCPHPHLLPPAIPGRTVGGGGLDNGLQICQQ